MAPAHPMVILDKMLEGTKAAGELEKLTKEYPRVKNLEKLVMLKPETELFTAINQNTDVSLQNLQKGLVAGISAMAPIASLYLDRGVGDQELDQLGDNIFDAIHLIALRNNGLTNRRKEIIKPSRKCEADKRVADKVLKRKNNTPQQPGRQQDQKAQPQRQKRFKHVSNSQKQYGYQHQVQGYQYPVYQGYQQVPQ